jgi:predicted metal-dependent enzyme (double-stranded beta helix superfamily)
VRPRVGTRDALDGAAKRWVMIAPGPISRLADRLHALHGADGTAEVAEWLRACTPSIADLPQAKLPADRMYSRTLLHRSESFEILAIQWAPNCVSAIHDHGGARCWLAVASGEMRVENYLRTDGGDVPGYAAVSLEGREALGVGGVDFRNDDVHLHRCISGDGATVTLHVYAKPIDRFRIFDERARSCAEIAATYDSILG